MRAARVALAVISTLNQDEVRVWGARVGTDEADTSILDNNANVPTGLVQIGSHEGKAATKGFFEQGPPPSTTGNCTACAMPGSTSSMPLTTAAGITGFGRQTAPMVALPTTPTTTTNPSATEQPPWGTTPHPNVPGTPCPAPIAEGEETTTTTTSTTEDPHEEPETDDRPCAQGVVHVACHETPPIIETSVPDLQAKLRQVQAERHEMVLKARAAEDDFAAYKKDRLADRVATAEQHAQAAEAVWSQASGNNEEGVPIKDPDGDTGFYVGPIDANNVPNGLGQINYPDGDVIGAEVVNGAMVTGVLWSGGQPTSSIQNGKFISGPPPECMLGKYKPAKFPCGPVKTLNQMVNDAKKELAEAKEAADSFNQAFEKDCKRMPGAADPTVRGAGSIPTPSPS